MSKLYRDILLTEFKIKASVLLKSLKSDDSHKSQSAFEKFQQLRQYAKLTELTSQFQPKLKEAQTVVAIEHGFQSWNNLKDDTKNPFKDKLVGGFLNLWFAKYKEALDYFNNNGGYLLPYDKQYIICQDDYIKGLGLTPKTEHWEKIGYNFVYPKDPNACFAIYLELIGSKIPSP